MRAVITVCVLALAACAFDGTSEEDVGDDDVVTPPPPARYASCATARDAGQTTSGVYHLGLGGPELYDAYCNMTVDGGGWTLALKVDGKSATFGYDAPIWSSAAPLNPGSPDRDATEAALASYAHLVADEILIETGDGTLAVELARGEPLLATLAGAELPMAMNPWAWADVLPTSAVPTCAQLAGVNIEGSGYRARIGVIGRDFDEEGCSDDYKQVVGVGIAHQDECDIGSTSTSSVGHVNRGCTIDDPFVYVYVR